MADSSSISDSLEAVTRGYRRLNESAGLVDRSSRVRLKISGPDRAKFLHNLTTNEIKKLLPSKGRETFVTSPQGKTLGFLTVLATQEGFLLVRTDPQGANLVLPHLNKYGIFDDVAIEDESASTFELHIAGPRAEDLVASIAGVMPGGDDLNHSMSSVDGIPIRLIRESPTGRPGFTIIGESAGSNEIRSRLRQQGQAAGIGDLEIDEAAFSAMRIEAGTPVFGQDLTEKNLPQELGRDARAISFVKGCYLGQETVARIDALGHVNQMLRGFRSDSPAERFEAGDVLQAGGKPVGHLTSVAYSPGWNRWVALGYLRESARQAEAPLSIVRQDGREIGRVIVCELPMIPPLPSDAETLG